MTTNAQIRTAICGPLEREVNGLHVYPHPVDNINTPAAVITGLSHELATFDSRRTSTAEVTVLVSHQPAQMDRLDKLLDIDSEQAVPAVLEDVTNNTDGISLAVTTVGEFGLRVIAEQSYYGAVVTLRVYS